MASPSDRDLILRARRGEMEAFGELVLRFQNRVFNVCYRMTNERRQAEDLTQETFLRIHSRLDTFDLERPFGPWIGRVAANVCLNYLESVKLKPSELDEDRDADENPSPETAFENKEHSNRIRIALASLPARYRLVIELRHFQEMSYSEIAANLGIQLSDVKSDLFRGRKMLAEKLK